MDIASDALVLPPDDAPVRQLSGGERRRVALGMALLEKPDLLLLDEPTNHLDAETIQWLEQTLREYPGTVIIVTHDRYFLDNITKWILELENGRGLPFEGNYSSWLQQKAELLRVIGEEERPSGKRPFNASWTGSASRTRAGSRRTRPAIKAYEQLASQADRRQERDHHPDRPRPATGRQGADRSGRLEGFSRQRRELQL